MGSFMRIFIIILLFSLPMLCNAGQVYKWRDKNGNIHYSDVEPADQKAQRKTLKAEKAKELAPVAAPLTEKQISCERARTNLKILATREIVQMDLDKDGKAEELSAEQRAQQSTAMQKAVDSNCSQ